MVQTLETLCFIYLRMNSNINLVKEHLKELPHRLLLKLAPHLSPYGLQILQKYSDIPEEKLRYLWLCTPNYPVMNTPKYRRRFQIQIENEDKQSITDEEFFCNALLHSVVDNIYTNPSISDCHSIAWLYYVHYPPTMSYTEDEGVPMDDLYQFLQRISGKITEMTVTAICADFIMKHVEIFLPCLRSVTKLNITLFSGSADDLNGIRDLINFTRKYRLCNVRLVSHTSKVSLEGFQSVWDTIHKERIDIVSNGFIETTLLTNCEIENFRDDDVLGSELEPRTKYIKFSSDCDEFDSKFLKPGPEYDMPITVTAKPGPEDNCDLYDCVFEPFNEIADVDTNIVCLEIILPQSDLYNSVILPALHGWRNLQSLTLQSLVIEENSFKGICKTLKSSLQALKLQDFDCERHENALLNLASKADKFSLLEKLTLHHCSIKDNFFEKLLDESVEDIDTCLPCKRLKFLDITVESMFSSELIQGLYKNKTLKHLKVKFTGFWDREIERLFWAIEEHPGLQLFDVSSSETKTAAFGLNEPRNKSRMQLHGIFDNTNIKQLAITSCFHSPGIHSVFNKDLYLYYTTSNVEVLILRDNSIDNEGLQRIGEILSDKEQFPNLRQLDLSCNHFDDSALLDFIVQLEHGRRYFEKLAVFGYNLTAKGDALATMESKLRKHCHILISSLCTISLRDTTDFVSVM